MNTIRKTLLKLKFKWMLFKSKFKKQKSTNLRNDYFIYERDDDK